MDANHNQDESLTADNSLLGRFTLPARLVIVGSILGMVAGTAGTIAWFYDNLDAGRYPVVFFALPVIPVMGLLCLIGLKTLKACGVAIYRRDLEHEQTPSSTEHVDGSNLP